MEQILARQVGFALRHTNEEQVDLFGVHIASVC